MDWEDIRNGAIKIVGILAILCLLLYSAIGTYSRVDTIKERAPKEMLDRGWQILRYEGFQYGSWNNHGGKVWYHVKDTANPNIQYRVFVTLWGDELQYHYGAPEILHRQQLELKN